jgi:diacylglycerol kinase (ATP)
MKILIIANPASGKHKTGEKIKSLSRILISKGCEVETCITTGPGHAQQRLRTISHDFDCVVAAGGDGTLNDVLNGLSEPGFIPICIFPTGTANVMAKELSLTDDPSQCAQTILNKKIRLLDMGLIGERKFLLFVSVGFDALVTKEVLHSKSKLTGYRRYAVPILTALYHYKIPHLSIRIDNKQSISGGLILISNTRTYGGIFTITDKAQCDSRLFDICIVPDGRIPFLIRYFLYAVMGKVSKIKKIRFSTAKEIEITSPEPVPVQVDGDYWDTTPLHIKLSSVQVPVIVNSQKWNKYN